MVKMWLLSSFTPVWFLVWVFGSLVHFLGCLSFLLRVNVVTALFMYVSLRPSTSSMPIVLLVWVLLLPPSGYYFHYLTPLGLSAFFYKVLGWDSTWYLSLHPSLAWVPWLPSTDYCDHYLTSLGLSAFFYKFLGYNFTWYLSPDLVYIFTSLFPPSAWADTSLGASLLPPVCSWGHGLPCLGLSAPCHGFLWPLSRLRLCNRTLHSLLDVRKDRNAVLAGLVCEITSASIVILQGLSGELFSIDQRILR